LTRFFILSYNSGQKFCGQYKIVAIYLTTIRNIAWIYVKPPHPLNNVAAQYDIDRVAAAKTISIVHMIWTWIVDINIVVMVQF
jgi:hypothetical protein